MKRIIAIVMIICTLCLVLAGCGKTAETVQTPYLLPSMSMAQGGDESFNRADITVDGDAENSKENISVAEAWNIANTITDKDVTITLRSTWTTTVDSSTGDMSFGSGAGFKNGYMCPVDRKSKNCKLTLDLNGNSIYRASGTSDNGRIFELRKDGVFTIKNGKVTGGCASGEGGAFWIDNNETTVNLENLTITQNYAHGNGGAIYCKGCTATLNIRDCSITDNTSDNYGGAIYINRSGDYISVNLSGKTVIKNNTGKDGRNNITTRCRWYTGTRLNDVSGLTEGSEIYIAASDLSGGSITADMTESEAKAVLEYFHADATTKNTIYVDSNYGDWYLSIKES